MLKSQIVAAMRPELGRAGRDSRGRSVRDPLARLSVWIIGQRSRPGEGGIPSLLATVLFMGPPRGSPP